MTNKVEELEFEAMQEINKKRPLIEQKMRWFTKEEAKMVSLQRKVLPKAEVLWKLSNFADGIQRSLSEFTPCKKGCSHCCHIPVMVSSFEAERIARATKKVMNKDAGESLTTAIGRPLATFTRVPCPFLKDSECSIYSIRPMHCRLHNSLAQTSELCNVYEYPDAHIPSYYSTGFWDLFAKVMRVDKIEFADLREWFPEK